MNAILVAGVVAAGVGLLAVVPRRLIRCGQNRLADEILARPGKKTAYRLLTPAEMFQGAYRRLPGVLGMVEDRLVFESNLDKPWTLAMERVRKIVSGKVLSTGRRLLRDDVLALTDCDETIVEFQMPHASANEWRRCLSEWAARQRAAQGGE